MLMTGTPSQGPMNQYIDFMRTIVHPRFSTSDIEVRDSEGHFRSHFRFLLPVCSCGRKIRDQIPVSMVSEGVVGCGIQKVHMNTK